MEEDKKIEVESLEPVVETLDEAPIVESLDTSVKLDIQPEVVTETAPGFVDIKSEPVTEAATFQAPAPEPVVISAVTEPVTEKTTPVVEAPSEPVTEPAKEEAPKPLEAKSKEKKKINPVLIIVIILLVLLGVACGFFIAKSLNSKDNGNNNNPVKEVKTGSITKVIYDKYTFDVPKTYTSTISNDMLTIEDEDGDSYAIVVDERSYSNISSKRNSFKTNFENNGYTTKEFVEKEIIGSKYLYIDINKGTNVRTFFRSLDSTTTFIGVIVRADGSEVTDNNLNTIEKILSTAKEDSINRGITTPENGITPYDDVFNLLKDNGNTLNPTREEPVNGDIVDGGNEPVADETIIDSTNEGMDTE